MSDLTLQDCIATLQANSNDEHALASLRELAESQDPDRLGEDPVRDIEMARAQHDSRGEYVAVAALLELECTLVTEDVEFLVQLYREHARVMRDELLDDETALGTLRLLLEWIPGDAETEEGIEHLEGVPSTWREVADRFIEEANAATEPDLRASLLASAASLVWKYAGDDREREVDELFESALEGAPGNFRAGRLWAYTQRFRGRIGDSAAVMYRVAQATENKDLKVSLFVQSARDFVSAEEADQAAMAYEQVLDFAPGHDEALPFLAAYFTERDMLDHLVAVYEDALRARRSPENEQAYLLQLGMIHWRMRQSPAEAEVYFARLRKIDPAHPGMLAFYREHLGEGQQNSKLLNILGDAQRASGGGEQKIELAVEMARKAETNDQHERAIDAWKSVQRIEPKNEEAREALKRLYRKAEKWNALAEVLKQEAEQTSDKERKLALLRELVVVYRDNLRLDAMVATTYNQIAALAPADDSALDQLIQTYEQMGRWNDLVQALGKKAEQSEGSAKVDLLLRQARLWIDRFSNYNKASEPLEGVLAIDPQSREAIDLLKDIYGRKRSWKQLFDVQMREVDLEDDAFRRRELRIELAKIAGERLQKHGDALSLWKLVVAEDPNVEGAIDALEKLGEREKDWDAVVIALEHRIDAATSDADRIKFLTKLGTIHGDQRKEPAEAAGAWKRILRIEPKNGRALRTLRESFLSARDWDGLEEMYAEASDWEGLVDVLGTTADRTDDPAVKVELSFRSAAVYEERIGEPARAFRSYERVLTVEPKNTAAAAKLAAIYEADEKWSRLAAVLEILADGAAADQPGEKIALLMRLHELAEKRLADPAGAFQWAAKAYAVDPSDDGLVRTLEKAAEHANSFEELARIYTARLEDADGEEVVTLRRRLASIAGERLGRPEEAIAQLQAIVESNPDDVDTSDALLRLYRSAGRHADRKELLAKRIARAGSDDEKVALLADVADLEELDLKDLSAAAEHRRQLLAIEPENRDALVALDRVLTALEANAELDGVLERRVALAESDEEQADLWSRIGDLRRTKLDRLDDAISAYESALAVDGGHAGAGAGLAAIEKAHDDRAVSVGRLLEGYYERTGRAAELTAVLDRRLKTTEDVAERRDLRLRIAELSATSLGDPSAAYRALEAAFLDSPADVELWDRIAAAAEEAGRVEDLVKAFQLAIDGGTLGDDDGVEIARRTAVLYDVSLGRPVDAEPFHRRVLAADPGDETAFGAVKELLTNGERWDDLQALYRARIDATVDADSKMELLRQLCFVFEDILDDPARATAAYEELLELDPESEQTRKSLDKLFRRTGQHRKLLEILGYELDRADGTRAVELAYEIGALHELKLEEHEQAVDYYERVLEQNPSHVKAIEALERLLEPPATRQRVARTLEPIHERSSAYAKLARDLDIQLEAIEEPALRVEILLRLAGIREDRLRDRDGAFSALAAAVETDPGDAEARARLARISEARRDHASRAAVLERAAEKADGDVKVELLGEIARLWDESVGDSGKAEAAYRRYIECDPDNADVVLPASRALERIHLAAGNERELAADLRRQVNFEMDTQAKSGLLVRLGDLLELSLGDTDGAIAVHRERLELDSIDDGALAALERLYARSEKFEELADVLRQREGLTDAPGDQRNFVMRVAELEETKLGRIDDAINSYADVVARFGRDADALRALCRLHRQAERWQDLQDDYEQLLEGEPDPTVRADLRIASADVLRTKLSETERALEAYREVLELVPGHAGAIEALEDVLTGSDRGAATAAASLLVPELRRAERYADLVSALDVLSGSDDARERLESLRQASLVAEHGIADLNQAFAFESRAAQAALSEPELAEVLTRLDDLAKQTSKQAEHVELLKQIIPDIMDGDVQLATTMKVAAIARRDLKNLDLARDYYTKALEQSPEHRPALDALDELLVERGDHGDLLETLRRKIEIANDPAERVQNQLRIAELCENRLDDAQGAIDAFEQVLLDKPELAAYQGLERLYAKTERFSDLGALFERMIEEHVGDASDLRQKLAAVRLDHLGDSDAAFEALKENLGHPAHAPSLAMLEKMLENEAHRAQAAALLEPVYTHQMAWAKVVSVIEARLSVESDETERKDILRRLGQIHEDYRDDLNSAFDAYARLFREDIRDEQVWDVLARLARAQNRYESLADVYSKALEEIDVDDDVTAKLADVTARIYDEKVRSPEKAAPFFDRALRFDPTQRGGFEALESALKRTSQWERLVALYREQADVSGSDSERVDLLQRLASVEIEHLKHVDEAVAAYRQVLEIKPDDSVSIQALDGIFSANERHEDLADLLRFRIDASPDSGERSNLRHRLGVLLTSKLSDVDGAIDVYEQVLSEMPHPATIASLEQLVMDEGRRLRITQILDPIYRNTDEWRKLVAIWEAQLQLQEDPLERVRILGDIGRAHEQRGNDPVLAAEAWSRAFVLDPSNTEVRQEIERLAAARGDFEGLVETYEKGIAATEDASVKMELLRAMAVVNDEKRGDPRSAIGIYERIRELDANDTATLDQLESLYTLVGDWTGLVTILERKVELVFDAVERAELLRRAASVIEELLGDVQNAIATYRKAAEEDPNDPIAPEALDRLLGEAGEHTALADVLERRLELETDPDLLREIGIRLADVAETKLEQFERAVNALNRVRAAFPDDAEMLDSLARLYDKLGQYPDLLDALRHRASLASGEAKVGFLSRIGTVLEQKVEDLHEAIDTYRQALTLDPTHGPTLEAMLRIAKIEDFREQASEIVEPLLRQQQRWDDVAAVLELRAAASSDPIDKRDRLREVAKVHEEGRADKAAAFDALCRALAEDASERALVDDVERLGTALEKFPELADAFTARASSATDPEAAKDLYVRVARIAEERLSDDARAMTANEKAVEQVGDEEAILVALDRLYARNDKSNELASILERRIANAPDDAARSALRLRLGKLRRDKFDDARGAFAVFQDVLDQNPSDPGAIEELEILGKDTSLAADVVEVLEAAHRKTGAVDRLPALYDIRLALAGSLGEKVKVLSDRAQLEEKELGKKEAALETFVRAFELDPRDENLLREVERLAGETNGWERVRGMPERVLEAEKGDRELVRTFGVRAAGYYLDKLGDTAAGEGCLRRAIAAEVTAYDAHERLARLLRDGGRNAELVDALYAWAEADEDSEGKKARLREAATLAEGSLADVALAGKCFATWVKVDGNDADALAGLCRVRKSEGNHAEVAELLTRRIDVEMSVEARLALRRELAALYAGELADPKQATKAYEGVLEEAPSDLAAIGSLEGLYEQQKRWEDLRGLVERRFELATSDSDRIAARVRLARLEETAFNRRGKAIEQLQEILQIDPRHPDALDELERLLSAEKKWDDLVARIEARIQLDPGPASVAHLRRLADLHEKERKAPADAVATLERIVSIDSRDEAALRAIIALHQAAKQDAETVSAMERLLAILDGEQAIVTANELAKLADGGLKDADRADAALRRALTVDPKHEASRAARKALFEKYGRFADLAGILAEEAEVLEDEGKKIEAFKAISKLYLEKLSDAAQAANFLERASKMRPDDRDLLLPLCDLYVQAGRGGEAVPVLRQIIASFGTKRSKELAGFHHRLGLALESAGDNAGALEQYDSAFKIDLTSIAVLRDLGKLTYRMADYERSQKTFRALLLQKLTPESGITKGDVYYYLGDMTVKTGDKAKAVSMLERAISEDKGHPKAAELLAQIKG